MLNTFFTMASPIFFAPIFIWVLNHWQEFVHSDKKIPSSRALTLYAIACVISLGILNSHQEIYYPIAIFVVVLIGLAIIDHLTGYLPDILTLPLLVIGLIFNITGYLRLSSWQLSEPIASIIGAALGYGGFWLANQIHREIKGVDGLGMGDAKLLAAIGAWFGPFNLIIVVAIASSTSLVLPLLRWVKNEPQATSPAPFGPYMVLGAIGALFI